MKKKQATIKDIARELKISHSTVSRALSEDRKVSALVAEKTRKRVQQVAAKLDYSPNLMAQGFVTGRTSTLGLLTYQIFLETFGSQTGQILRAADKQKYHDPDGHGSLTSFGGLPPEDQTIQIKAVAFPGYRRTLDSYTGRPRRVRAHFECRAGTSAGGDFYPPDSRPEWGRGGRDNEFLRGHRAFDPVGSQADRVYRDGLE